MLALMVTLIPLMLLATSFLKIRVIESQLPQAVEKAIAEDQQKKDRQYNVELDLFDDKGMQLRLAMDGKVIWKDQIAAVNGGWDLERLAKGLEKVKSQHPDIYQLQLSPASSVAYADIVAVIDEARKTKNQSLQFPVKSEDGEAVFTKVMFPNVVFSNVVES